MADKDSPGGAGALALVTVKVLLSPVRGQDGRWRWRETWDIGEKPVRAYLPQGHEWERIICNGGVIPPERWGDCVLPGSELICVPRWGEITTGMLIAAAISTVLSVGLSYAATLLFPARKPKFPERESPTFGFEGISSTVGPGAVVPVIYGRHRVGLQLLSAYISTILPATLTEGGSQALHLLGAIGEGEFDTIETGTIELNEQPVANFPEVTTETRLGTAGQAAIADFPDVRNTFAVNQEIPVSPGLTYTTTSSTVNQFMLQVTYVQGLYRLGSRGESFHENLAHYNYRWRVNPAGTWSNWVEVKDTAARFGQLFTLRTQSGLAAAKYDIQLEFIAAVHTNVGKDAWKPTLASVTEISDQTETYANTALLAVKAIATERLHGQLPNVTVIVKGKKVRVGSFGATPAWSDNPAWGLMDLLTNTRYGLAIPDGEIDLSSVSTFATYCDQLVDDGVGGTEKRCLLNFVLDRDLDAMAAINEILSGTRATLVKSEGRWKVRVAQDDAPVQLISWANIQRNSLRIVYTRDLDRVNVLEGRFANQSLDFDQDVLTWPEVNDWPATVRKSAVSLPGVTRPSQMIRELKFELNTRQLQKQTIEFEMGLEGIVLEAMDIFRFAHPLPAWGVSGRVTTGANGVRRIIVDEDVTFNPGVSYHVYLRYDEDTVAERDLTNPTAGSPVTTTTLDLLGTEPDLPAIPTVGTTLWAFGKLSPEGAIKLFRAVKIERTGEFTVKLTGVEHNSSIYTDETPEPIPSPSTLFNPLGPAPPLTSLVGKEVGHVGPDGVSRPVIRLEWTVKELWQAGTGFAPYDGALVFRRFVTANATPGRAEAGGTLASEAQSASDLSQASNAFMLMAEARGAQTFFWEDISPLQGAAHEYKVVPISARGVANDAGALTTVVVASGVMEGVFRPPAPTNLRIEGQAVGVTTFTGRDVIFLWDAPISNFAPDLFVKDYLVEVHSSSIKRHTAFVTGAKFNYTYEMNSADHSGAPARSFTLKVFSRSNTAVLSATAAELTVSNAAPDMSVITPTVTPLIQALLVDWGQFNEPADLDKYELRVDTKTPPTAVFSGISQFWEKAFVTDLTSGTTYYVQIVPHDAFGAGIATPVVSGVPLAITGEDFDTTPPAVPTGLALTTGTTLSADGTIVPFVQATWTANTESDFDHYQVNYRVGSSTVPTVLTTRQNSVRLDGMAGNVTVSVKLLAVDQLGNASAFTAEASITTGSDTAAPAKATSLTVAGSFKSNRLLWTPPADADYAYAEVWARQNTNDRGPDGGLLATKVGEGYYSFVHDSLGSAETWYYWGRTVDTSGNKLNWEPASQTGGVVGTTLKIGGGDVLTTEVIIAEAAQIGTAVIENAHIEDVSADKIIAGVIDVLVRLGVNNIELDGVNSQIIIKDNQATPVTRVRIGNLGGGTTGWGIQIYNASGTLMFGAADGVQAAGIKANVIEASHLRTDVAVITVAAQIANLLVDTAHIKDLAVDTIKVKGGAITNGKTFFDGGSHFVGASEQVIGSLTFSTDGGQVVVFGQTDLVCFAGTAGQFRIRKDSVTGQELQKAVVRAAGSEDLIWPISLIGRDESPAATQTYKLTAIRTVGANNLNPSRITLVAINLKK